MDLEEENGAINETMVRYEILREDKIANGKGVTEEDNPAACEEFLQKRSDIRTKIEALLKLGDEAAFCEVLKTLNNS